MARPEFLRMLFDAGLLRPDSPRALARAFPHLAARGPHLGVAFLLHASGQGGRTAVVDASGSLTWKQLNDRSVRIGRGFRRRGVQPGERVAFALDAGREFVECLGAAQKAAAWAVAVPTSLHSGALHAVLHEQRPRVLVYESAYANVVAEAVRDAEPRPALVAVGHGEHVPGSSSYEEVIAGAQRQEFRPRPVPQPGVVLYSPSAVEGGEIRGVQRDTARGIAGALGFLKAVGLRRRDVILIASPLAQAMEFGVLALGLVLGATLVLPGAVKADELLHVMEDDAVTVAVLDPAQLQALVDLPADAIKAFNRSRLQIVLTAAAPLEADLRRRASNLFGPVLHDVYGTTETGWISVARPEDYDRKPTAVGKPVPGVNVSIRNEAGRVLPAGVTGDVFVSSDLTFTGYTGDEAKTGEIATGHEGWMDDEGYLYLVRP